VLIVICNYTDSYEGIIDAIKSRKIKLGEHAARMREVTKFGSENIKLRYHTRDLGVHVRVILRWM
jgi:hypothetical protein